jgi:hypothetical protein
VGIVDGAKGCGGDEDEDGADDDQLARRSVSRLWWGRSGMRRRVFEKSMQLDDRKITACPRVRRAWAD